jgi:nucleoid DNA-binding protein
MEGIVMTKAELVAQIAQASGITKQKAKEALKSLIEAIGQVLKKDGEIRVSSLGTFRVRKRKARAGVNPRTGAKIKIPATKAPAFRAGKALREAVKVIPKKSGTNK